MNREFVFPARLAADLEAGGYVVTFPDLPEIVTQGNTKGEAIAAAADALEEAIAGRIRREDPIPEPTQRRFRHPIALAPLMAAKAALYLAAREAGVSRAELARRLEVDPKEVQRLLDPHHPSKLPRLARALAVLGQRLELRVTAAA